jgi:hypothetical protein
MPCHILIPQTERSHATTHSRQVAHNHMAHCTAALHTTIESPLYPPLPSLLWLCLAEPSLPLCHAFAMS